jgi:acetylornithine deacetylase/succinyl-diaminopimelate desuccinylase-like protein
MYLWEDYLAEHQSRFVEELMDFLRIPSISSLAKNAGDVKQAAAWVQDRLQRAGAENVRQLATGGHPVVYGDWLHAGDRPTIMIYGHFDVQPVDPLDLWSRPPFEPAMDNDRIYARGASDDKGNMLIPILAIEALLETAGDLPVNVKFFFEGQEEIGSPQLPDFIETNRELLACDAILSADGGQWAEDQPVLVVGRRGLCALQIDVQSAAHDVHSGTYGGTFMNPIRALALILASMHGADGKILVDGFYDDVRFLSEAERAVFGAIPYDKADYMQKLGLPALFGEPGYSTYERSWIRPTLEINGIWGGFQEEGIKTVIPSQAHAKISCRLVPDQEPDKVLELVSAHIHRHAPAAVTVSVSPIPGGAWPCEVSMDHPANRAVEKVLRDLYDRAPYTTRMGGTIPVCGMFARSLSAPMISLAFGLKDECIHAPDEFFRLSSFRRGQHAYCMVLAAIAHESTGGEA